MDSIIFDLDGTLWDSVDTILVAWNYVLKKEAHSELTRQDFEGVMGLQMEEISKKFFPSLPVEERRQLVEACGEVELAFLKERGGMLYPGVEDVLKNLAQTYKLYIVSNCKDGYIEVFYQYHKLGKYFSDFENPGRTSLSKGENINLIIDRNKLSDPVYVGDTKGDLQAARFAGIPFIYAKYGFGDVSEYDKVIEGFEDLLRIF